MFKYFILFLSLCSVLSIKHAIVTIGDHDKTVYDYHKEFDEFKRTYKKNYAGLAEEEKIYKAFEVSMRKIKLANQYQRKYEIIDGMILRTKNKVNRLKTSYDDYKFTGHVDNGKFAINKDTDLTEEDFIKQYLLLDEEKMNKIKSNATPINVELNGKAPDSFDWRDNKKPIPDIKGFEKKFTKILNSDDEEVLKQTIYEKGPVVAGITGLPLRFYAGGIFDPWFDYICRGKINHAVVIVGYGEQGGIPYWTIKNNWGDNWGENGYARIRRGEGRCEISKFVLLE